MNTQEIKKEIEELKDKIQTEIDDTIWDKGIDYAIKDIIKAINMPEGFWNRIDKMLLQATLKGIKLQMEDEIKLIDEIGERFYYHSDIDGVDLKLNELTEYQEFKEEKILKLEKELK